MFFHEFPHVILQILPCLGKITIRGTKVLDSSSDGWHEWHHVFVWSGRWARRERVLDCMDVVWMLVVLTLKTDVPKQMFVNVCAVQLHSHSNLFHTFCRMFFRKWTKVAYLHLWATPRTPAFWSPDYNCNSHMSSGGGRAQELVGSYSCKNVHEG